MTIALLNDVALGDEVSVKTSAAVRKGEVGTVVGVAHGWGSLVVHVQFDDGEIETLAITHVRKGAERFGSLGW